MNMDVNTNPLLRMIVGIPFLIGAGYVFWLIGIGKGGTWGCFWILAIVGLAFFLSGMLWYFWP